MISPKKAAGYLPGGHRNMPIIAIALQNGNQPWVACVPAHHIPFFKFNIVTEAPKFNGANFLVFCIKIS
ncbi:hypothetical protein LJC60_04170 [Ruminococcaceae bacterium OttesenSCG-928-D13]|nr:hypothetical protein [Ruminococcaceae bacterium OttesenSCG-928-D13]